MDFVFSFDSPRAQKTDNSVRLLRPSCLDSALPAAIGKSSSPPWHRRLRQKRSSARRRVRQGIHKSPDLALLAAHHGTAPSHQHWLLRIKNSLEDRGDPYSGYGITMTWGKGYNQDGSPSQPWQVWRGSWGSAPWKQSAAQPKGGKNKSKGGGKGKPQEKNFPACDHSTPSDILVQEVRTVPSDSLLSELQKAINQARKLEGHVRKLQTSKTEKVQQWQKWEADLKASYCRERSRFCRDMNKLEKDTETAVEELEKARAHLRVVALEGQAEAVQQDSKNYDEEFHMLLAGSPAVQGQMASQEEEDAVLQRAISAAQMAAPVVQTQAQPAHLGLSTPLRRTGVPPMTPATKIAPPHQDCPAGQYLASPSEQALTDPYMRSPLATPGPRTPIATRPKELLQRTGVKESIKPKHPVHPGTSRNSPSLADKLEARRIQHSESLHFPEIPKALKSI